MGDLTEHFSRRELECSCKCGLLNVKGRLLVTLEAIREGVGKPVNIESGCRCTQKNKAVKGVQISKPVRGAEGGPQDSAHTRGEAADIWVKGLSNRDLGNIIKWLYRSGKLPYLRYCYLIKGTSNTRVHVGVDEKSRKRVFGF